jgi:hypothetical protein
VTGSGITRPIVTGDGLSDAASACGSRQGLDVAVPARVVHHHDLVAVVPKLAEGLETARE